MRPPSHLRSPVASRQWEFDLAEHDIEDAVEDLALARDVMVDGHRLDAEVLSERADRQRRPSASRIGDGDGTTQHAATGERFALAVRV